MKLAGGRLYEDGEYGKRNPTWHSEDAGHKARVIRAVLDASDLPPGSVVDVGCGSGGVLAALDLGSEWGPLEGWDIAPDAIERAPTNGTCVYTVGDALASGRTWHLAMAIDVLEHIADDEAFLHGLAQLAPHVLLRVPLDLSAWDALRPRRLLAAREQWGHVQVYNRDLLHRLLADCGLEVRSERYDRLPSTARGLGRISEELRDLAVRLSPHRGVRVFGGYSIIILASRRSG